MKPFNVSEFRPGLELVTDEQIAAAARGITATIFHLTSTCAMGPDDTAVVDDRRRVRGVDASVMPMVVSGNTNAATIMIAQKASDMIREHRRQSAAAMA